MNSTTTAPSSFPMLDTAPSSDLVSLRNFVVDEDRANLSSDLWKPLDKSAFILAQREAIEAFNIARAMSLSEQSAANEERRRLAQAEEAARSLARSWNVEGLQSALLKNTPVPPSSSPRRHPSSSPPSRPSLADNPLASSSKVSSSSGPATATEQKRRKASISSSSQPPYSYSTSNYSYHYQSNQSNTPPPGTSQASVHAQQQFQGRKHSSSSSSSSASSRDIQAGQILNPKESSPRTQSPSSSASAQAAAAEREKEREKEKGKERSRSNSNSTSRKRSSSSAAQHVHSPQAQAQVQVPPQQAQEHQNGPRDIFSPVRFNCAKCGNSISSVVLSQPSLTLTSPDPFAHPFTSVLHVICSNASCGAVHCRGCLQIVKCRDVDHPSSSADSQALVLISSTPPASNPISPTRLAFSPSKSPHHTQTQCHRACAGGPGCALWSCCPSVRVIAVWEALRAFDTLFGAEAGFQVSNQQGQQTQGDVVGRQYREAYIRTVISSKADKSMKKFEDGFVRVLKVVASWLQFPSEFGQDGDRRSTIVDPDEKSHVLLHLARLFLSSHLLQVVHTFLSNRIVKDWMTHAETYLDVLDVVGKMMDCGLGFLLKEVSGVQSPAPSPSASGFYNPFAVLPTSATSSLSPSPSQSPPPVAPLTLSSSSPPTLYDLVTQLETYRGELKKFLTKVSFGVTVDKASKLHDAITYLVLQLVVGEF